MSVYCECANGHRFSTAVLAQEPDTNAIVLKDETCPECGAEITIIDWNTDDDDLPSYGEFI